MRQPASPPTICATTSPARSARSPSPRPSSSPRICPRRVRARSCAGCSAMSPRGATWVTPPRLRTRAWSMSCNGGPPVGRMTDTGDHLTPPDPESGPVAEGGELPLGSGLFKAVGADADSPSVNEALGGRPRLDWSPSDASGGRPAAGSKGSRSGFTFDLGGALARLDSGGEQTLPTSRPAPAPPPEPAGASEPPLTPLPRRGAVSPSPAVRHEPAPRPAEPSPEPAPRSYVAPSHSVFDDAELRPTATAITPSLPSARSAPATSPPSTPPSTPSGPSLPINVPTVGPAVGATVGSFGGQSTTLPP